jgi:hypothetical protein
MAKVKKAAYEQYKKMKRKEQKEALKKAKKSIYYNPLKGGPLSKDKDPLSDVKEN